MTIPSLNGDSFSMHRIENESPLRDGINSTRWGWVVISASVMHAARADIGATRGYQIFRLMAQQFWTNSDAVLRS